MTSMKRIDRMIAVVSLLAIMASLTTVQSGSYEETLVYAYIQNNNELNNGDASTTVPTHGPFLIVLPCCDYMSTNIGSP